MIQTIPEKKVKQKPTQETIGQTWFLVFIFFYAREHVRFFFYVSGSSCMVFIIFFPALFASAKQFFYCWPALLTAKKMFKNG